MLNITYLCNVTMDPNVVDWVVLDGAACQKGWLIIIQIANSQ